MNEVQKKSLRALKWWLTAIPIALIAGVLIIALVGCTPTDDGPSEESKSADVKEHKRLGDASPSPSIGFPDEPTVLPSKVAVFIRENKGYTQIIKGAPWSRSMGEKFGLATQVYAWGHPSQPNYIVMVAGSNRGITSNNKARISGQSLLSKVWNNNKSLYLFGQTMSSDNCRAGQRGYYHERHIPFVVFKDEKALCEKYVVGYDKIKPRIEAGTLGNVNLIVPNNCKNSHDCSLSNSEAWLKAEVERMMSGPDYQSGELLIVLTWDEDNKVERNRIHTVLIHPSLDKKVVNTRFDLYSIHKMLAKFGGVSPMTTRARDANDILVGFGLDVD